MYLQKTFPNVSALPSLFQIKIVQRLSEHQNSLGEQVERRSDKFALFYVCQFLPTLCNVELLQTRHVEV